MSGYRCRCGEQIEIGKQAAAFPSRCPHCMAPLTAAAAEDPATVDAGDPGKGQRYDSLDAFAQIVLILLYGGVAGLLTGYFLGGLCVGTAIVINVVHNLLPVFVFVMPLIVLGFLAFSPIVYGMGVGTRVGYTSVVMRSRSGGTAASAAVVSCVVGLALVPFAATWGAPAGTDFFDDTLLPFICLMVGASLNLEWLAEPKPIDVAPWIVFAVLGVSAGLGVLVAAGRALEIAAQDDEVNPAPSEEPLEETDLVIS